jgi:hypothetical protein
MNDDGLDRTLEVCGCGHLVSSHDKDGCTEWWRYPDVLDPRPCACDGAWTPRTEIRR